MPVWGKDYLQQARDAYREGDYASGRSDPELFARKRILALNDGMNRLQAK
jgi:hypothetical protein